MDSSTLSLEEQYKQNCEDFRFYGDMRFKQLTVWSIGMGFVLNVLYGKDAIGFGTERRGLWYIAAFFWTSVIWVMEVRSSVHGVRRLRFKTEVESEVPKDPSPKWTLLNATNAVALLYAVSCAAWCVQLERAWGIQVVSFWVLIVVLVILASFNLREYWALLRHALAKWQF